MLRSLVRALIHNKPTKIGGDQENRAYRPAMSTAKDVLAKTGTLFVIVDGGFVDIRGASIVSIRPSGSQP